MQLNISDMIKEACVETLKEAYWLKKGADRIELCFELSVGGLTSPELMKRHVPH